MQPARRRSCSSRATKISTLGMSLRSSTLAIRPGWTTSVSLLLGLKQDSRPTRKLPTGGVAGRPAARSFLSRIGVYSYGVLARPISPLGDDSDGVLTDQYSWRRRPLL